MHGGGAGLCQAKGWLCVQPCGSTWPLHLLQASCSQSEVAFTAERIAIYVAESVLSL